MTLLDPVQLNFSILSSTGSLCVLYTVCSRSFSPRLFENSSFQVHLCNTLFLRRLVPRARFEINSFSNERFTGQYRSRASWSASPMDNKIARIPSPSNQIIVVTVSSGAYLLNEPSPSTGFPILFKTSHFEPSKVASLHFQKIIPWAELEELSCRLIVSLSERDEKGEEGGAEQGTTVGWAGGAGGGSDRPPFSRHVAPAARRFSLFSTYKVRNTEKITCPLSSLYCYFIVLLFIVMIVFRDTAVRCFDELGPFRGGRMVLIIDTARDELTLASAKVFPERFQ